MAKKDQDLQAFKASDNQQTPMPRGGKGKAAPAEAPVSAGFPTIERLLEQEVPDLTGFNERIAQLREMQESGSAQQKGAARKALAAYERCADLIEFLWQTKSGLPAESGK